MADEGLKIRVGADLSDLNKELKTAEKDMKSFGASVSKGINAGGFDDFTQKIKGIKKPTSDATRSLVDLSRIAQDAPYGFMGIANNLNPALESFQRLKVESGSTGKALKAMAVGLAGPAGIGVALGVISSLVVGATQKYGSLSNALKALTGDLSSAQKTLNEFNKEFAKSGASALSEKSNLESLLGVAKNVALSTTARKNAIEEINNKYPQYLKNLNLETLNTDATSIAIGNQIKLLDLRAKQKAIETVLEKKYVEQIENENKSVDEQLSIWDQIVVTAKKQFNISDGLVDAAVRGTKKYQEQNQELNKGVQLLRKQQDEVNTAIAVVGGFKIVPDQIKKERKKAEKLFSIIGPEIKVPVSFGGKQIFSESTKEMYEAFKNFKKHFAPADFEIKVPLKIDFMGNKFDKFFTDGMQNAIKKSKEMREELQNIGMFVGGPLSDTFANLFRTIATDGKLSMKQVGQAVQQLVIDLVAAVIKAAVLAVVLKVIGGKTGVAGTFSSIFQGLLLGGKGTGMATGGIVPAGFENDTFPARLSSREAVIPLDRLDDMISGASGGGTLTTRVSGNDLIFILERSKRAQIRSFG